MRLQEVVARQQRRLPRVGGHGSQELHDRPEFVKAVFERCACQRPGSATLQALARLSRPSAWVLDLLRFVKDDHVPVDRTRPITPLRIDVLPQRLVADDEQMSPGSPLTDTVIAIPAHYFGS